MIFELKLSWPDRALSPNARPFWAVKARAAKNARREAHFETIKALGSFASLSRPRRVKVKEVFLHYTFIPPDRRGRDDDNLIASMKPYRDGIAEALGVDDVVFHTAGADFDKPHRPAHVIVTVEVITK